MQNTVSASESSLDSFYFQMQTLTMATMKHCSELAAQHRLKRITAWYAVFARCDHARIMRTRCLAMELSDNECLVDSLRYPPARVFASESKINSLDPR